MAGKAEAGRSLYRKPSISDSSATNGVRELHSGPIREPRFTIPAVGIRTVFLYRRQDSISWGRALAVIILFGIGVKTKENAVSLPGILFLTDVMWPRPFSLEGPRKNWRLYALMLPGALLAMVGIFRMLAASGTAGFSVATFKWYQYTFTEARAIFTYVRLALLPVGQMLDHDFPTSRTILQHGAIFYMALLAGLILCRDSLGTPLSIGQFRLPDVSDVAGAHLFDRAD